MSLSSDSQGPTGLIFDIQRFSLFDGPGIRTTVFFKGCPLHCPWCHNPEGMVPRPELLFQPDLCVQCGACVAVCPQGAHHIASDGAHTLDRAMCAVGGADSCMGACANVCPSKALRICGQSRTIAEVMAIVRRDRGYYADTGGGLTLSGGEPLLQPAFAAALLAAAKAEGLHTAVETSGFAAWSSFEAIRFAVDLFLFDIKETDSQRHAAFTGVPLAPILQNLRRLMAGGAAVVLRLPMIPGYNDRPDHIEAIARLADSLPRLVEVHLLPYHRLGEGKHTLLGLLEFEAASSPPEAEQIQAWKAQFAAAGLTVRLPDDA